MKIRNINDDDTARVLRELIKKTEEMEERIQEILERTEDIELEDD